MAPVDALLVAGCVTVPALAYAAGIFMGRVQRTPVTPCPSCAEKDARIAYWKKREERAVDRLLASKGLGPVAADPPPPPKGMSDIFSGLAVSEIDTTKPLQPGQAAMRGAADR